MSAAAATAMNALGRALGCTGGRGLGPRQYVLPEKLYYHGHAIFTAKPRAQVAIDCTQSVTPTERDARDLRERGREGLVRFFAGRYSARLKRVVRPRE